MPQLRAPDGSIVDAPDEGASQLIAGGYEPVTLGQAGAVTSAVERPTSGVLAPLGAAASSFLSGATLGGSDYAFKELLDKGDFERLRADREEHPIVSGAGQLAGAIAGGPTPAGYLSRTAGAIAEGGGVAAKLGAGALEGAVQNAGAYLADTALGDRDLSAEGLVGALGTGMEFGVGAGGVALGIEQGTIAARRLFSRVAGSAKEAQAAEQAWAAKYQSTIEAHDAAADIARAKLAEAGLARQQAQLAQQRAAADLAEARIPRPVGAPEPAAPSVPTGPGAPPPSEAGAAPPGASPGTPSPAAGTPAAPTESPAVETARLLHDRAMQISEPEVRAWDAANGARLRDLQIAGGIPPELAALTSRGPETAAARSAALSEAAEREMAAALAEHDAARAELEDALARIEAPGVQTPAETRQSVPVSEFGAPGQRGLKSRDELARAAAGEHSEPRFAGGTPQGDQPVTRQLRGMGGASVEEGAAVGKRPAAAVEPARAPAAGRVEVNEIGRTEQMRATMPDGSTRDLGKNGADAFLAEQMPPGFRPAKVQTHRSFAVEHGLPATAADVAKLDENAIYIAKPSEIAEREVWGGDLKDANRDSVLKAWKDGDKLSPIDAYVTPDGAIYIEDGNHRLQAAARDGDRQVAIRFRDGTNYAPQASAREIGDRIRSELPGPAEHPGIPDHAAIRAHEDRFDDYLSNTVSARDIATRGYYEPPGGNTDPVRVENARKAIADGQREPIKLTVSKEGNLIVTDGRHRLQAAIEADAPIKVKWSTGSEPATSDVLRHGPRTAEPAGDDLFAQLQGTGAKVNEGRTIGQIGAESPARAEYVTARADKQKADAEHFRGKALAAREARAQAVAQGETPNPFHEPVTGIKPAGDPDAFFRDLTAPKTRDAYVAANIGRAMREEGSHAAALAKVEREWAERAATEAWAERAAVLEYEGGYSRAEAERIARNEAENAARGPGAESPQVWEFKKNPKRVEAAKKAAAASVERLHEIHSAVASNLSQDLQTAWNEEGYRFLRDESARIRGVKDRINAASKISEAFTEKYGSASETLRGYEGDRFYRRAEIEAKHAESWADEQERKYYGAAMRDGHPLAAKQLEAAHDAALERAETAATPGERAVAAREAQAIERQLTAVGARPGAVEDVAAIAATVTKYEKASARLTEALGADAPPAAQEAAKAFRAAESEVERKSVARTTRAIEDHAANLPPATSAAEWNEERMRKGLGDALAPPPKTPAAPADPRVAAAKGAKLRADANLARARAAETEAKIGAGAAKRQAAETRATAEAARATAPMPGEPSKLGSALTAIGVAGELGIPGIPHPKDIPVIGPLLSMYLKYRAVKAAAGRFVGRIPATGDARAAALVARTKDKIATAVDRTLGLAEQLAPKARGPLVATAVVLGHRVFDDGQPDAPKGASEAALAAVRIREISTAATRPDMVEAMVRKRLGGVTDPDLIDAATQVLQKQFQYLASTMPKAPAPNPYTKTQWVPSAGDTANLARRLAVLSDPQAAIDNPTPAGADALNNFYPKLAAFAQQRLAERAADLKNPVEYHQLVRASLVFQIPMHVSLEPENAAVLRSAFTGTPAGSSAGPASPGSPAGPPPPSIAAPAALSNLYQPSGARAQR